jgi:hypothetical protein
VAHPSVENERYFQSMQCEERAIVAIR